MALTHTPKQTEVRGEVLRKLTRRAQAEYAEMPGLSVTLAQAQRLLGIDEATCAAILRGLVESGVLRRTPQGRYVRA
jgi:DNA-binding IclR family transcriptional regulator